MEQFLFYRKTCDGFTRKLWLLALLLLWGWGAKAQCPTGGVALYSQAHVNNFATNYPNCTEITGYLYISGSDITDLSPLSNIQSIGGLLEISYNSQLTNLDGLSNLTQIGGGLYIQANSLTNLDGLSNLTQIGGYLYIVNNSQLTNLDGLSNLTEIGGNLVIESNSQLTNLDGLSALESINGDLVINNNAVLTDISGLQNIDPATILPNSYGLYIRYNSLLSVCNLDNFCTYLAGSGLRTISGNAGDCVSVTAVTTACIPACDAPTNLTATNITSVSATLGWTSTGNNFDIEWGPQGFTQGSGTTVTDIATNSYNLTSLSSNTQYQFYVRQDCTLNESDWVGPFAFTTLSQCPTGDVILGSQADVNAFGVAYPNCTQISGSLHIQGNDITDLSPLSNITNVGGYLAINFNPQLTGIDELDNLVNIAGFLAISGNPLLTNLDGLINLESIGGDLNISNNADLEDISGLQNIDPTTIQNVYGFGLYIVGNTSLSVCNMDNFCTYLAGSGLRTISNNAGDCVSVTAVTTACTTSQEPQCPTGDVALYSQADVNNFATNYPNCTEITGYLYISGSNITDLSPLSNIQSVGGYLDIYNNSQLTNLDGLSNLTQIGGYLYIYNNYQLTNLDGLSNLTQIGGYLYIQSNSQLTNLDGLSNLTQIGGYLGIQSNAILENLDGLSNLTQIGGFLLIQSNSQLTNLDGLSNLTEIGGYLNIQSNSQLTNLDGLSALESINGDLVIYNNAVLTDISGLQNIDPATILSTSGLGLFIQNNPLLSVCNLDNFCTYLAGSGLRTISQNAGDCISVAAVNLACNPVCDAPNALTATATSVSATLSWTSTGNNFDIEWGVAGFTPGSGTLITDITTNSYNLTSLSGNTQYQFYVRQDCTLNESDWTGPFSFTTQLQCPTGDVNLSSQAQVDAFGVNYAHCTNIIHSLYIGSNIFGATTDINNLNGLSNVTSIGGYLDISSNPNLQNLDGLSNVTSVGSLARIWNNQNLTNLNGLSSLTTIGSYLAIDANPNLSNLNGLSNLTSIGGKLQISYNNSLTNIDGLQNIDSNSISAPNGLVIVANPLLSVCNLPNFCTYLQGSGPRNISGNAGDCISEAAVNAACTPACDVPTNLSTSNVTSVSAKLKWTSTGDNFDIEWGVAGFTPGSGTTVTDITTNSYDLTNLDYATQYQFYVRRDCTVNQSNWAGPFAFTTLSQCPTGDVILGSQAEVDAFAINYPNCTEITGYLYIVGSDITDLSPLSNIQSIGGDLFIYNNSQLTNLDGLSNLTEIGGALFIYNNSQLTNLDGLSNLTSIEGYLLIQSNSSLTDISGLQNIDPNSISANGVGLYIVNNSSLSVCNLDNFCTYLAGSGLRTISGNAGDCVSVTAVTTACTTSQEPQCPTGDVGLYSQADVNNFATNYPNCTEITGYLYIVGSDITDLSPLSNIQSIGGYLNIYNNSQLTNLDGLSNLTSVGGYLDIYDNLSLTNLDGLSNLTSIGTDLAIYTNSALTDISGLQNIDPNSISYLLVVGNPLLSVCNLPNFCTYLQGSGPRNILGNAGDCISEAALIAICTPTCDAPTDLSADNITYHSATLVWESQGESFEVVWGAAGFDPEEATAITDITTTSYTISEGLDANTQYDFYVRRDCTDLQSDWAGPFEFTTLLQCPTGDIEFFSQADVDAFALAYPNCGHIEGDLYISGNTISDLSSLVNLETVEGSLIVNNTQLTSLEGFNNLESVGNYLSIFENPFLTNLNDLNGLTSVYNLQIYNNNALTDISGLQNLDSNVLGGDYGLYIINNINLSVCNLPNFCAYLSNPNKPRTISGNAGGCLNDFAMMVACAPPCELPTNLSAGDMTSDSITLNWTSSVNLFDIQYGSQGFGIGQGMSVTNISDTSYTFNDLTTNAYYDFYVRAKCSLSQSEWVGPYAFMIGLACPNDDVILNSQTEVNDFIANYPSCTEILGDLIIQGNDISDLSVLSNLAGVNGDLRIQNTQLTNLHGLHNLSNLEGDLYVYQNDELISFLGSSNLTSIQGDLYINENSLLENLSGLSNIIQVSGAITITDTSLLNLNDLSSLTSVGENLLINFNSELLNLNGLNNLTTIGGYLDINNNSVLENLNGLSGLTTIEGGKFYIEANAQLTNIVGLHNLNFSNIQLVFIASNSNLSVCHIDNLCIYLSGSETRIISGNTGDCEDESALSLACGSPIVIGCPDGDIVLASQEGIESFAIDYPYCTEITGSLTIGYEMDSTDITDLSALSNISSIEGSLSIFNTQLTSLEDLSSLMSVEGDIQIWYNWELTSLFDHELISFDGYLDIWSASMLESLSGFANTTSLTGLSLYETSLTNLNDLSNLTAIGSEGLYFAYNIFTDFSGLNNLTTIDGDVYIADNHELVTFEGLNNLTSIVGTLNINWNTALSDISALANIDYTTIEYLEIFYNSELSECSLPSFCAYFTNSGQGYIEDNASDCMSIEDIQDACAEMGACNLTTTWNGTSWSNGEPTITTKAIIDGALTLTSDIETCELEVTANGSLTIPATKTFTVKGQVVNNSTSNDFVIANNGILLQIDDVENQGMITVERASSPMYRLDYTIWSSPVSGMLLKDLSNVSISGGSGTLWNRVYTLGDNVWNQVWATQQVFESDNTTTFGQAKGYMYRAKNTWVTRNSGNPAESDLGVFTGVPNNGTISINTPFMFNAIGNPYPSPIDGNDLLGAGATGLYFWTNTNTPEADGTYQSNNWAYYNQTGGTGVQIGDVGVPILIPDGIIQPGQGFVAGTTEDVNQITFNNEMRMSTNGSFFRQMSNERHRFWLNLSDEMAVYNQILVGYMENATQDVDAGIDAEMFAYEGNAIYSIIDNNEEKFVIQGRSLPFTDADVVKLGFRAIESGSFSISLNNFDGIFEQENLIVYLKDNFNQTQHNLKNGAYSFVSEEGFFENRFEVVYQTTMSTDNPNSTDANWIVYRQDKGFQVQTIGFEMKEVSVYDILGRRVYTSKAEGTSQYIPALGAEGVFIVKVTTTEDKVLNKKVR